MDGADLDYGFLRAEAQERELLELYRRVFVQAERVIELFQWRKRHANSGGIQPFVACLEGKLVGAVSLVPFCLRVGGKTFRAAWHADSAVAPEMRRHGIGRELLTRSVTDFDVVLAKGTNPQMYKLRKRCGYRDVPNSNYLVRVLSPLRVEGNAKQKLLATGISLVSILQRRPVRPRLSAPTLERFGEDFDCILRAPAGNHAIISLKDSSFLNWRYGTAPSRSYAFIAARDESRARGAAVLRLEPTAWIVDLISANSDTECIETLIGAAVEQCRSAGAASIYTFATSTRARQCLCRQGFVEIPRSPNFTYLLREPDGELGQALAQPNMEWNFWHGDADIELYS